MILRGTVWAAALAVLVAPVRVELRSLTAINSVLAAQASTQAASGIAALALIHVPQAAQRAEPGAKSLLGEDRSIKKLS